VLVEPAGWDIPCRGQEAPQRALKTGCALPERRVKFEEELRLHLELRFTLDVIGRKLAFYADPWGI
jgi:hypothetical protein